MKNYQTTAEAILNTVIYATIATSDTDGTPWAAPQFIVYEKEARAIYWCAARSSKHAQNIHNNRKAYIVVYDSSVGPGEGSGVYMQATAHEVTDPAEREEAMTKLIKRHRVAFWTLEDVQKSQSAVAVFKAEIQRAWVNEGREENGQFVLYREPVEL